MASERSTTHRRRGASPARTRVGRALGALLTLAGTLALASSPASAAVGFGVVPNFPTNVTVGQTGVPASLTITNTSTPPESSGTVMLRTITLVPSCATPFDPNCPAPNNDPGVFSLSATGIGGSGTSCASQPFSITLVDPVTGKYAFTPMAGGVFLQAPPSACTINFTFNVLKVPTKDALPGTPGLQTAQVGFAQGTPQDGNPASSGSSTTTVDVIPGGRYTPLTPARILDTRDGTGAPVGPLGPGATTLLQVTGRGGVPATGVSAVAMNVTVTNPTAQSFLTTYPSGQARPLAANLNFVPAQTVPNLVVVKVGSDGKVAIFNQLGSTDVIADVAGWYSDPSASNDGRLQPLSPARILDSRDGTGGGFRLGPGQSFDLQVSGRGGVPATGAGAAVMNIAVTNTDATSFLTAYPTGQSRPLAANLNWVSGLTVSNRAMVKLGTDGKVTLYNNSGNTDVVVDVNGWYTDASVSGSIGAYNALVPARILDTRDGTGGISAPVGPGGTIDVQVAGQGGVPATGASAVILNVTVTQPSSPSYFTIFPAGQAMPLAADLNFAAGENRPNLVVVKLGAGGKVSLFNQAGSAHVVFDVAGWFS